MSKKVFDRAREVGKKVGASILRKRNQNKEPKDVNENSSDDIWKTMTNNASNISQHFQPLKKYLPDFQTQNFNFIPKSPFQNQPNETDHPQQQEKYKSEPRAWSKPVTRGLMKKKEKEKENQNSSFLSDPLNSLKKSMDFSEQIQDIKTTLSSQKEKIQQFSNKAQQTLSEQSQKLKKEVNVTLSDFAQNKNNPLKNLQNQFNQHTTNSIQYLSDNFNKLKKTNFTSKHKSPKEEQSFLSSYLNKIFSFGAASESTSRLANAAKLLTGGINKLMSKLFWQIALLIGFIAFSYGLGTSLPKQIREYFQSEKIIQAEKKKQENKKMVGVENQ